MASPGGIDKTNGRFEIVNIYEEKQKCQELKCERKAGDNRCDEECNTHTCGYDGGDCRLGVNPWKYCNATSRGSACWDVFQDGYCDEACNTKECLFDGRDCDGAKLECNPNYDVYCSDHYGNGHCDASCNNAACGWDGLDCEPESEHHEIIPGSFYVVLTMTAKQFDEAMQKRFERYLSLVLRTNFKIRRNADGSPMVYDFNPAQMSGASDSGYSFNTNLVLQGNLGIIVYLEIDNVKCPQLEHCYDDAEGYANLFSAMMGAEKLSDDWGIVQVGARANSPSNSDNGTNTAGIVIGILMIIVTAFVVVGMMNKKKRARGVQWFPDGFVLTGSSLNLNRKRPSDKQEVSGFGSKSYASGLDIERWSEDDPLESASKRRRQDYCSSDQTIVTNDYDTDTDSRTWTQQHINAADIRNPEILGALTPPQGEVHHHEMMTNDVNGRGPMGMTPLMIAAIRGTGLEPSDQSGELNEDGLQDSIPTVIQDLLAQGATLKVQMDKTGETPLHLAARYQRADAAKVLLDAKVDDDIVNVQDYTGRTPLHAAVAADAQGVFQHLLKNRYTNLDAKSNDGTTPLMLAARMAIEGMVEALIEANADVNIADDMGKTALHWAAAVNNVDAVNVLLKNNANRDAQDNRDETPLFLAAREGSYQAARALLDHGANREIQDHMDRLPIHVAQERMHQDIINLLEEYPSPAQMPGGMPHPFSSQPMLSSGSPPGLMMMNKQSMQPQTMRSVKKPSKKPSIDLDANSMMSSSTLPRQQARRQGSVKQQRGKKSDSSSMMLSPEHSPYEPQGFMNGNPLAMSHPNLEDLMSGKQPPSYEAALARSLQGQPMENQYFNHNRQQSMPASVASNYSNHLSPPHSNLSHVQSPPHSTGAMSPTNPSVMSPPQSCGSLSPPQQQQQHNQIHSSPIKSNGMKLPTSPTHLAALRGATHQRHQASFDYAGNDVQMYMMQQQQQQQQQQQKHQQQFLSPSPDSPQWSNPSPQSHSDWSEGIHSPPSVMNGYHMPQQQHQMLQSIQQQTDAVII